MVEVNNILSKTITSTNDKASYDAACKRLLANKIILAWIMKSCVEEFQDCDVQEIADKYIEGEPDVMNTTIHPDEKIPEELIKGMSSESSSLSEGTVTYDIRFYAVAPVSGERIRLIINIEAQNEFYPGYPIIKRGIYYCSRMISSQYGTEFSDSHYEKIKKVYSIWICMHPPKYRANTINDYSIAEKQVVGHVSEAVRNYDLMTTIMICLGDTGQDASGILKLLEVLLSSERKPEEKKLILQEEFSIKMTKKLEKEVSAVCNLSDYVEAKGIEKGIAKGIAQGKDIGTTETKVFAIKRIMYSLHFSAEKAMSILAIPKEDYEKYLALL